MPENPTFCELTNCVIPTSSSFDNWASSVSLDGAGSVRARSEETTVSVVDKALSVLIRFRGDSTISPPSIVGVVESALEVKLFRKIRAGFFCWMRSNARVSPELKWVVLSEDAKGFETWDNCNRSLMPSSEGKRLQTSFGFLDFVLVLTNEIEYIRWTQLVQCPGDFTNYSYC